MLLLNSFSSCKKIKKKQKKKIENHCISLLYRPSKPNWSSSSTFVSGAGRSRFKSRTGLIEHSVGNSTTARRATTQTRRQVEGAYRGRAPLNDCLCPPKQKLCPPKQKLCPPKRGLCPKEINRLGATGVQIEAQIGVWPWPPKQQGLTHGL